MERSSKSKADKNFEGLDHHGEPATLVANTPMEPTTSSAASEDNFDALSSQHSTHKLLFFLHNTEEEEDDMEEYTKNLTSGSTMTATKQKVCQNRVLHLCLAKVNLTESIKQRHVANTTKSQVLYVDKGVQTDQVSEQIKTRYVKVRPRRIHITEENIGDNASVKCEKKTNKHHAHAEAGDQKHSKQVSKAEAVDKNASRSPQEQSSSWSNWNWLIIFAAIPIGIMILVILYFAASTVCERNMESWKRMIKAEIEHLEDILTIWEELYNIIF